MANFGSLLFLIPLLPFVGFVALGLLGRRLPKHIVGPVACLGPAIAFLIALGAFRQVMPAGAAPLVNALGDWMRLGTATVGLAFSMDHLSGTLTLVVTGIGTLIHIYSIGYMRDDPGYARFFAYLNFFMAAMLILALADNILLLFMGWEGVGLASYLLIGFWFDDEANASAGRKAFVVNRVGDFAFVLGIFLLYQNFPGLRFADLTNAATIQTLAASSPGTLTAIALLLFAGATGKSAQVPLYVWLPDAMAGPTPVSALIHAATMVTSGVYLVARLAPLYAAAPYALDVVGTVGAVTALLAGFIALSQFDIKRVLAYSTVSQLGYMFVAAGAGASGVAVFHLVTHAFFKALLFLGAGAVIHSLHHEQNLRRMGGLRKTLPKTYLVFLVGSLAIAGFPFLSGFFSKDEILHAALEKALHGGVLWKILFTMAAVTAAMTAFYTFRLFFMAFAGPENWKKAQADPAHGDHGRRDGHRPAPVHDAPSVMLVPLFVLAFLSIVGGFLPVPHFVVPHAAEEHGSIWVKVAVYGTSVAAFLVGLTLAWRFYIRAPQSRERLLQRGAAAGLLKLSQKKLLVDELYEIAILKPLLVLAQLLYYLVDRILIDLVLVEGAGSVARLCAGALRKVQSGRLPGYAAWFIAGVVVVLAAAAFAASR